MNKTLASIIEAVKDNRKEEVTFDDLRYALLAMVALHYFDHSALSRIPKKVDGFLPTVQKTLIELQVNDSFGIYKGALNRHPKDFVGWSEDPDNPEYQERRRIGLALLRKVVGGLDVNNASLDGLDTKEV